MIEVTPLKYGETFKRAFRDPEVFCQFAYDVLGIEIKVDKVHTEYEYPKISGFVKVKYDLFAEDLEHRVIVEIQHVKEPDFFYRFLYYHLVSLMEQVRTYREYSFDKTVYTIVVLTSVPRDDMVDFSVAISDFSPIDEFGQKIEIYLHRLVFLAPRLLNERTPEPIKPWLAFIADSLDGQIDETRHERPIFQKVIERIKSSELSPEELSEVKDEVAWELRLSIERQATQEQIALGMKKKGMDPVLIAELTGLMPEQIDRLKGE
jgi:hypothetical protein